MQLFHTFVVACVTFASSIIANPTVAFPSISNRQIYTVTATCANKENLTQNFTDTAASCIPAYSEGHKSPIDCFKNGGSSYYCVLTGPSGENETGICFNLDDIIIQDPAEYPDFKGGECFRASA